MYKKFYATLFACILLIGSNYGQEKLINENYNRAPIGQIKLDLEKSGYVVWDSIPGSTYTISLLVRQMPVSKFLDTVYRIRGYKWEIVNNKIIVIQKDSTAPYILCGWVMDAQKEGLANATIRIKGTSKNTICNGNGFFIIKHIRSSFTLSVSMAGYQGREIPVRGEKEIVISLSPRIQDLTTVSVSGDKKDKAETPTDSIKMPTRDIPTGAVTTIDNKRFNYSPLSTIANRLNAYTGALWINTNSSPETNQSTINIRSRTTIDAQPTPLIVLDQFPYNSDLNNINPNDIESISILKDAAATSKYGFLSANGILLLNTKKGNYNEPLKISAIAAITIGKKPDLQSIPQISTHDFEKVTKMLFDSGFYANLPLYVPKPPNVEVYQKLARGLISPAEADATLQELRETDRRKEAVKHLHQTSINQQYYISMDGGSEDHNYFSSFGYDKNRFNLIGNNYERTTWNLNNTIAPGIKGLEIQYGLYLSHTYKQNNGIALNEILYPNEQLVDQNGQPKAITRTISQLYKETAVPAGFLDWDYVPLKEIGLRNNKVHHNTLLASTAIDYKIIEGLHANFSFRYDKETDEQGNLYVQDAYFTRDLINQFTQSRPNGIVRYIPLGDIRDEKITKMTGKNYKAYITYSSNNQKLNRFNLTAGTEIRHIKAINNKIRNYGIIENATNNNVDYGTFYPLSYEPGFISRIPQINSHSDTTDFFFSLYGNGSYTFKDKYTAFVSLRKDESNIFGVKANQKGVPLLSAGINWHISKESFFQSNVLQQLSLRLSNGYCANANKSYSALTAIMSPGQNPWGATGSAIINAPNPYLSWETVRITNAGIDFSMLKNRLWGSVDYFIKEGKNLLGLSPIDPTGGVSLYRGNVARMKGNGMEMALNGLIGNKTTQWKGTLLASYVKDKVTTFTVERPAIWYYCEPKFLSPKEGNPLYSVYSLNFSRLDPTTGDPIGFVDNHETKDYNSILQSTDEDNLVYHGPAVPTFYGSFNNSIIWKKFELGFTVSWKAGYYFRKSTINYTALFNGTSVGHPDFAKRWQQPGDERFTNIPSLRYPGNYSRDQFFGYSTVNVEKGDHIRLQDIRLQYTFRKSNTGKQINPITELFIYARDLGPIWKANKKDIDPDYPNFHSTPFNITMGVKIQF